MGKMKDETRVAIEEIVIEELVGSKPEMYSFLVATNEHRKAKGMNKNTFATISHYEHKNVLLNKKCRTCNDQKSK